MRVVRDHDVRRFLERVGDHLRQRPAENNLMLGLLSDLAAASSIPGSESASEIGSPVFLAVEGENGVEGVALQTPPRALIVSRAGDEATRALVEFVVAANVPIPGVNGPDATAERFAAYWTTRTGRAATLLMTQTVYEIAQVRWPAPNAGKLREAESADETLLAAWFEAFHRESGLHPMGDHRAFVHGKMAARQLFVWEIGVPVSMAAWVGRTGQGVRVGYVYTPPSERKKGYASAIVAALTQRLLDEGSPQCFLFAVADNATANKIYRALGYEPVTDFRLYDFSRA
jgi:predicted GNAT family acetyltransferase